MNLFRVRGVLGTRGLELWRHGLDLGRIGAQASEERDRHLFGVFADFLRLVIAPLIVRLGAVNDRVGMRAVRSDRDHRQENADDAHQNTDPSGVRISGVFRRDFKFRHNA